MAGGESATTWTVVEVGGDECDRSPTVAALRVAVREMVAREGGTVIPWAVDLDDVAVSADVVIGYANGSSTMAAVGRTRGLQSVVLVRCELSDEDLDLIAGSPHVAVLTIADPGDRDRLVGAVAGHLSSKHEASDVVIEPFDVAHAAAVIEAWITDRRRSAVIVEEVSIVTPDGWVLGADLYLPHPDGPAAAVVLMHTGRSDRAIYDRLAGVLARRGVAALALDWRGRGVSTNRGRFVDFTSEQQREVRRDVVAAYDYLADRPEIDGRRLGLLGIAHGAGFGIDGALGDERTRALVAMTAYHILDADQRSVLESGSVAVLCVACTPNTLSAGAMREIAAASRHRRSRLIEFPEGVLGYQLFDLHDDLEPTIANWLAEVLSP